MMDNRTLTLPHLFRADLTIQRSLVSGYGVFAKQPILPGETIEECPLLFIPAETKALTDYQFAWNAEQCVFALGYGSLYNHSEDEPNAEYQTDKARNLIVVRALRPIQPGDEIFVNYGKSWFSDRGIRPVHNPKRDRTWSDYKPSLRDLVLLVMVLVVIFLLART
jgi:hypothetical protein